MTIEAVLEGSAVIKVIVAGEYKYFDTDISLTKLFQSEQNPKSLLSKTFI